MTVAAADVENLKSIRCVKSESPHVDCCDHKYCGSRASAFLFYFLTGRFEIHAYMGLTNSTMLPLATTAPNFALPDTDSKVVSLSDFKDKPALLVMFICNHCPYVQHVAFSVAKLAREYQQKGLGVVAINSNDAKRYPADSPAMMGQEVKRVGYTFPYLYDQSQEVAKAYQAACTPEFYVFDKQRKLAYRGRFDASSPGNSTPTTGDELRAALDAVLAGKKPNATQNPSVGCNIKWKPGNEPDYLG